MANDKVIAFAHRQRGGPRNINMNPAPDNPSSWQRLLEHIDSFPDNDTWRDWRIVATRFVKQGIAMQLDRYFRAGKSMHHFLFSTLDHHDLRGGPHVTVVIPTGVIQPEFTIQVAYGTNNLFFGKPELSHNLSFDEAFSTFRRFLFQLWTATQADPIPEDIRFPIAPLNAPVLPQV